jgi:carboxymethylenebutenolidase
MCHDDDSRPPAPPVRGPVGAEGPLTLTSADGTQFLGYTATPAGPPRAGVVILPDVRGLHPYYQQLAVRFAEAGFHAVAIDWFGRTLGLGPREGLEIDWISLTKKIRPTEIAADVAAARAYLATARSTPIFSVGFCFGGSQSWRLGANAELGLAGCMGFYGRPPLIADVEESIRTPLLLLVGGADRATPVADFEALSSRLSARGQEHEMYVYPGAPHSFFDRAFADWSDACADAWRRILGFTGAHGARPA